MRLAVFTVADNQHVPQARTLLDTVARFLPDAQRFLVLADEPHPLVTYPAGCEVVPACALDIPDFLGFAFRYDPVEFAAALKPFAFLHLLRTRSCTHCVYLDPDVELFSPLPAVMEALAADAPFVLTPHVLAPAEDADGPGDVTFMRDGAFNLGFLGVSATPAALDLLAWWSRWTRRNGVNDRPIGLYLDQRFIDLVPGFASGVRILHDPTLNVAHWNLSQRAFVPDAPGGPRVDGRALGFFHYSGFDPADPGRLSTEGEGWRDRALPEAWCRFLASYAARLQAAGHGTVPGGLYAFGRFASGVPIPGIARRMFRDDHEAWAGDPFATFEAWCHLPAREAVPGLGSAIPSLMTRWLQARHPALDRPEPARRRRRGGGNTLVAGAGRLHRHRPPLPPAAGAGRRSGARSMRAHRPAPARDRADATVVAPLADAGPAGQAGRATAASLSDAAGRVESLDVLAADDAAGHRQGARLCLAPGQLRPFSPCAPARLPAAPTGFSCRAASCVGLSPPVLAGAGRGGRGLGTDPLPPGAPGARDRAARAAHAPAVGDRGAVGTAGPAGRRYVLAAPDGSARLRRAAGGGAGVPGWRSAGSPAARPAAPWCVPRSRMAEWDPVPRDAIAGTARGWTGLDTPPGLRRPGGARRRGGVRAGAAPGRGAGAVRSMRALAWGVPVVATDDGRVHRPAHAGHGLAGGRHALRTAPDGPAPMAPGRSPSHARGLVPAGGVRPARTRRPAGSHKPRRAPARGTRPGACPVASGGVGTGPANGRDGG